MSVGPFAVVEQETVLGDGTEVRAHAVVKRYTELGPENVIHEGAVLGGEPQDVAFEGGPTRLVIGSLEPFPRGGHYPPGQHPEGSTVVGSDGFFMAYAHIAHDCRIGDAVIMANNVALAGHVEVASRAFLSGGALVHQFCRIGRLAMVGGNTKLVQDALPFVITDGDLGRAVGLNVVGLRRARAKRSQLQALKEAYRLLLRSSLSLEVALDRMATIGDPMVEELMSFTRGSKRGFAHTARGS